MYMHLICRAWKVGDLPTSKTLFALECMDYHMQAAKTSGDGETSHRRVSNYLGQILHVNGKGFGLSTW